MIYLILSVASTRPARLALLSLWMQSILVAGCANAPQKQTDRPPLEPAQVQVYQQPPTSAYVHIADVSATSRGSFKFSTAAQMEAVIERLKRKAARLGANGLLLHGVADQSAGSVGAGISTETNNPHTAYGLGFGASTFFSRQVGDGEAIFVSASSNSPPASTTH